MLWRFVSILNPCVNKCSNHTLYWQDTEIKIATRCNNWGTQSPTYPISWTIMLPQNKIRRNHEGCFFMKKTGSMPCTGTETTTITDANKQTNKCNAQYTQTASSDGVKAPAKRLQHFSRRQKKSCRNLKWMKLFRPSLSSFCLPYLHHLSKFFSSDLATLKT